MAFTQLGEILDAAARVVGVMRKGLRRPNLEDPIVIRFANARDDEARRRFLSDYGLLLPGSEVERGEILDTQTYFRRLLAQAGSGKTEKVSAVNTALASHRGFALAPSLDLAGGTDAVRLSLKPQSLLAFMLMEVAMVALHGARLATCNHCGEMFLTGPLTWRRSHARFHADRCRVAAMRARNAERAAKG
jgi:hypothetical protein